MIGIVLPFAVAAFFGAFVVGLGLTWMRGPIERVTRRREDAKAVQASHVGEPLRFGGVAVFAGLLIGAVLLRNHSSGAFTILLLVATIPVFFAGLAEDLGHFVSPSGRFVASLASAAVAVALLGIWVRHPDLAGLESTFSLPLVAITITVLFAGFYCHSVNLIDGMNGLSSAVVISSALGIAFVAADAELGQITALALLLAASMTGFLLLNWPRSFLLLGDAGAYGVGHVLVWLAIGLGELAPATPTASILLILFWPLADALHTIFRRLFAGQSVLQPDRMHLHQKIRRGLEIAVIGAGMRTQSNPVTTLLMVPMVASPVIVGVALKDDVALSWIALGVFSIAFAFSHVAITALVRSRRRRGVEACDQE
jgi:UDP-GlcNAc:undecaprenyl-phosphate/decaprenyl-phosphate GlcNAc-1-phosphate transferase